MTRSITIALTTIVCLLCMTKASRAQQGVPIDATYPNKPVHVVLPVPPGGTLDPIARPVMARVAERLGKAFVLESKPGASGAIGVEFVAKAPPDGYTLLVAAMSHLVTVPLTNKVQYDTQRDLEPIAEFAQQPYLLAANAALPVTSVKDLIMLARSKPGSLNYGSGGDGTTIQMAMEMFAQQARIRVTHIPYKGGGPMMVGLIGGEVHMVFNGVGEITPFAKSGKVKALAVSSLKRSSIVPDVPTIAETGLPGLEDFEAVSWYGLLAPKGTPAAVIASLGRAVNEALNTSALREAFAANGIEPTPRSPAQFQDLVNREIAKWTPLLRK